jgi:hypothetical protein
MESDSQCDYLPKLLVRLDLDYFCNYFSPCTA